MAAAAFQQAKPSLEELTSENAEIWCDAVLKVLVRTGPPPHLAPDSATNGIPLGTEDGATPILSVTPEYRVPAWAKPNR